MAMIHVETPKINIGITDCVNTKPTIEKEEQSLKSQATFDRLNDSSKYTGIYRRLNNYDSIPASKVVSNVNKRKRLVMSPSSPKLSLRGNETNDGRQKTPHHMIFFRIDFVVHIAVQEMFVVQT